MRNPDFKEEKEAWRQGYGSVIGVDESGRGCLAGPVVAAAVSLEGFPRDLEETLLKVKDSKKLSPACREQIFKTAKKTPKIRWSVSRVSEKTIDRINIYEASRLAMKRAVLGLHRRNPSFVIVDGIAELDIDISQKSVVKGDEKVFSCALASIFAKVVRDRAMVNYHKKYLYYGFDRHKGYPTRFHQQKIRECGLCRIHRKSYGPCRRTLAKNPISC